VPTDTAPTDAAPVTDARPATPGATADVRRTRLYVLSRTPWVGLVRRASSIAALATLDSLGLALGIYVALVVREIVYGHPTIYWSLLWEGPKH